MSVETRPPRLDPDPPTIDADLAQEVEELHRRLVHAVPADAEDPLDSRVHERQADLEVAHLEREGSVRGDDEAVVPIGDRGLVAGEIADTRQVMKQEEVEALAIAWTRDAVEVVWSWHGEQQADWIEAKYVRRR